MKFIFAHPIYVLRIPVKFVYEGHQLWQIEGCDCHLCHVTRGDQT